LIASTMKLSGILIASTTAQQARQRENKEPAGFDYSFGGADDAFASLYDFGGDDAFGGFDMSAFNDYGFGSTAAPTVAVATDAPDYGFDLGDAFGDASADSDAAADYADTVASDYDGADVDGSRPASDDEVKSNFVVDTGNGQAEAQLANGLAGATNEVQDLQFIDTGISNGDNAQRCFVGSSGESNGLNDRTVKDVNGVIGGWFTEGKWEVCKGENDTCQMKVVRRNERIIQITSKCANRHSCVDNMRQNFSPEHATGNGYIYSSWIHQACRPQWNNQPNQATSNNWNARQMARDSVCFFCVEPCRTKAVWDGSAVADYTVMRDAECVGRAGPAGTTPGTTTAGGSVAVWNAAPIKSNNLRLFEDCNNSAQGTSLLRNDAFDGCSTTIVSDYGQHIWDATAPTNANNNAPNMAKLNYYSVIDNVKLANTEKNTNHPMSLTQSVSQIQFAQITARDTNDVNTDVVDPLA
jgi:hypothetical protein